ncbi:MAG: DUF2975 domain-containing protein [Actinomycetes bacterium]
MPTLRRVVLPLRALLVLTFVGLLVAQAVGLPSLLLLPLLAGAALGLLMVVLRALLLQATTLRTDMDAGI